MRATAMRVVPCILTLAALLSASVGPLLSVENVALVRWVSTIEAFVLE